MVKKGMKKYLFKRGREKDMGDCDCCSHKKYYYGNNAGGGVYCLGFIGAVIYYTTTATSFWMGVLGILKALVWPAFLVYGLLKFLGI